MFQLPRKSGGSFPPGIGFCCLTRYPWGICANEILREVRAPCPRCYYRDISVHKWKCLPKNTQSITGTINSTFTSLVMVNHPRVIFRYECELCMMKITAQLPLLGVTLYLYLSLSHTLLCLIVLFFYRIDVAIGCFYRLWHTLAYLALHLPGILKNHTVFPIKLRR